MWSFGAGAAEAVPGDEHGRFSADQAYVVLAPAEEAEAQLRVYLWAGDAAPQENVSAAAKHASDLKSSREASFLRQQHGQETDDFKQLFASFEVVSAGVTEELAEDSGDGVEGEQGDAEEEAPGATGAAAGSKKSKKKKNKSKQQQAPQEAEPQAAETKPEAAAAVPAETAEPVSPPAPAAKVASPAPAPAAKASPSPAPADKATPSPVAAASSPAPTAEAKSPASQATPAAATPPERKGTVEEVPVESVSKVKQQLMGRIEGSLADPLAKKQQSKDGEKTGKASTFLADSAKAWGGVSNGGASAAPKPMDVKVKPGEKTFGFEELKAMRVEAGINMALKEAYLSDAEFEKVFGKDRVAFLAQPAWRQQMAKKQVGLW